jgi:hypothetical protein
VAIEFDFNNVSEVKHAWNAAPVGVQSLGWESPRTRSKSRPPLTRSARRTCCAWMRWA